MTSEQLLKIEHSFKHGDSIVFKVGEKFFVAFGGCEKHRKEAQIQMKDCGEVDETCFEPNGEYNGETKGNNVDIFLQDPYADNENEVATIYYNDEIIEVIKK